MQSENATTTVDMWLARPPFYPASIRYFLIFSLRIVLCPREDFLGASFSLAVLSSVSAQKKPIGRAFSSSMCRNRRIVRRPSHRTFSYICVVAQATLGRPRLVPEGAANLFCEDRSFGVVTRALQGMVGRYETSGRDRKRKHLKPCECVNVKV